MEPRERDLLRAVAKFLADYCGEDALQRWREKLSDAERQRLALAPGPVRDAGRGLVETFGRLLRALVAFLAWILRVSAEVAAAARAALCGRPAESFGPETP
jgi:hypothetical protein